MHKIYPPKEVKAYHCCMHCTGVVYELRKNLHTWMNMHTGKQTGRQADKSLHMLLPFDRFVIHDAMKYYLNAIVKIFMNECVGKRIYANKMLNLNLASQLLTSHKAIPVKFKFDSLFLRFFLSLLNLILASKKMRECKTCERVSDCIRCLCVSVQCTCAYIQWTGFS